MALKSLVKGIKGPYTAASLCDISDLHSKISIRPYNEETKEHEKKIRWRRTADEILKEGYVYSGKACTDITVLFIAMCKTLGLEAIFVKVAKDSKIHSIAEVRLDDGWYICDVSAKDLPVKGQITGQTPYKGWRLWKKGRDSWDLGLKDYDSIREITY